VDVQPVFKRVTLSVISKIAFTELETEGDETINLIRDLLDASGDVQRERQVSTLVATLGEPVDSFTAMLPFGLPKIKEVVEPPSNQRLIQLNSRLKATENRIINARRKQIDASRRATGGDVSGGNPLPDLPNDLLSVLISSKEDERRPLTDGEIATIVREIIIAGSDTTASSISATLFLLAREPGCQQRVRRELDAVVGTDPSRPITYAEMESLTYLRLCIKEAMRLYPAADVVFRTASETATVGGYTIPEGSGVIISPVTLGRSEEQWGPDAHRFRPERFEETGADGQHTFPKHPCAWLPFGAGPRGCIGGKLALVEATTAVATVLRRWLVYLPASAGELTPRYSVTVDFDGGVAVRLMQRSGSSLASRPGGQGQE
jgi:cytochrome P450